MSLKIQTKLMILLSTITLLLISPQITGRPLTDPDADTDADAELTSRIQSIFEIGSGTLVYNITSLDEIVQCPGPNNGKTYCREVISYSVKMTTIRQEQFDEFKDDFKDDVLPEEEMIESRMDIDESAAETPCKSQRNLIHPEGAQSKDAKWLLVVQHEQYKQGVLIEECANEEQFCEQYSTLPPGETTKCKQKFIYCSMVVLVGGELKKEMVKLPSACECTLCAIEAQQRQSG